jgi:hypothetical protein
MATSFFHEETFPIDHAGRATMVRYYFDDIAGEVVTRSFRLFPESARTEFIDNGRIPFADLRVDLKTRLLEFLIQRERSERRLAS